MRSRAVLVLVCAGCLSKPSRPTADREVVFDNTDIGTLTDFVVLVKLEETNFDYSAVDEPTTDLRFFDPDTATELSFDVDEWNPTGTSLVWVKVPSIDAGSIDDRILLFAGPGIGAADPTGTWSEFDAVWHLSSTGSTYPNAAAAGHDGHGDQVASTAGQLGLGAMFEAGNSQITVDPGANRLFDAWRTFTLEMWVNPELPNPIDAEPIVIDVDQGDGPMRGGRLLAPNLRMQIDIQFSNKTTFDSADLVQQQWNYVVFTSDGMRLSVFGNGMSNGGEPVGGPLVAAGTEPHFGGFNSFGGMLDEVRISQSARDSDWVAAQYRSMIGQFAEVRAPE